MKLENIKLRFRHLQPYNKEEISKKVKALDYLFDEITIRSSRCVLKNDEDSYTVSIGRNYIDFELKSIMYVNIVEQVIDKLGLQGISKDVRLNFILDIENSANNFNNLLMDVPDGVKTEFLGFRYRFGNVDYFTSMFLNNDNQLLCRIGMNLSEIAVENMTEELEFHNTKVEKELMPIIHKFIEGVQ